MCVSWYITRNLTSLRATKCPEYNPYKFSVTGSFLWGFELLPDHDYLCVFCQPKIKKKNGLGFQNLHLLIMVFLKNYMYVCVSRYSDSLWAARSVDRIPVGAGTRFSATIQTGPEAHPASYTMGTGSFPGVKWPKRGVDHPPPISAEVKERVELYLYSPSGPSWPVLGWTLPLPVPISMFEKVNSEVLSSGTWRRVVCTWVKVQSRPLTEESAVTVAAVRQTFGLCEVRGGRSDTDVDCSLLGNEPVFRKNLRLSFVTPWMPQICRCIHTDCSSMATTHWQYTQEW